MILFHVRVLLSEFKFNMIDLSSLDTGLRLWGPGLVPAEGVGRA